MSDPRRAALDALLRRPAVAQVLALLDGDGEQARIVGGAVRNALLGRAISDIDVATTARPALTLRRARDAGLRALPTGIEHGTVTILAGHEAFEVTTLRDDVATDGRHAIVRFGRDFAADAHRRDFTINALSLDRDGRLHDVVGGLADLGEGRVRFIGDARTRIREDYLRVLRFFRFHAQYGSGDLDRSGLAAAVAERDGLAILSPERVRVELLKLLAADRAVAAVTSLSESGLLARLAGGIGEAGRLARVVAFESGTDPDPVRRLAAFLVSTAEDAARLRHRLRLSNAEHDRLNGFAAAVARLRSRETIGSADMRRLAFAFGPGALVEALAVLMGEPRPILSEEAAGLRELYAGGAAAPNFPLSGRDLVARGIPPGPQIGQRLSEARNAWLDAGCPAEWSL